MWGYTSEDRPQPEARQAPAPQHLFTSYIWINTSSTSKLIYNLAAPALVRVRTPHVVFCIQSYILEQDKNNIMLQRSASNVPPCCVNTEFSGIWYCKLTSQLTSRRYLARHSPYLHISISLRYQFISTDPFSSMWPCQLIGAWGDCCAWTHMPPPLRFLKHSSWGLLGWALLCLRRSITFFKI
jgi:hypothetical protein